MNRIWAVVPAAGSGSRMGGDQPKQFLTLRGRSLLYWSVAALLSEERIVGCVVALPAHAVKPEPGLLPEDDRLSTCAGGAERADSVAAALAALAADPEDWVLVHDAARPCLNAADLRRLVDQVCAAGVGGLLAEPVTDTLKRADDRSRVAATVDRAGLWRAQTPQMFRVAELREALAAAKAEGSVVTDEASAMERRGLPVQLIPSSASNIKVTYGDDLAIADFWLSRNHDDSAAGALMSSAEAT